MKTYRVKHRTVDGEEAERLLQAGSVEEAEQIALAEGLAPLAITEAPVGAWGGGGWFRGGVPLAELYHFTRLFGTLTRAGIPIIETLETIRERTSHPRLNQVLEAIITDIRGGTGLGGSFGAHPEVFDFTYLNLVNVAEESGELSPVLERLSTMLDKRIKLRRAIRKALTYPALVMVLSGVVTWAILTYIVPRFKDIYSRFGGDLPPLTKFTIGVSDLLTQHSLTMLIAAFLLFLAGTLLHRTSPGKRFFDRLILGLPLLGPMYHTFEVAQFAKSFSILIHSGVTVLTSLEILAPAVNRVPIREALLSARDAIQAGKPMGASFSEQEPWFPDLFNKMVGVGERSGNLTEMLDHVSDYYEEEFYNRIDTLASLIEPMMIVFLGVIIGTIVISLYLPIFGMAKLIARR